MAKKAKRKRVKRIDDQLREAIESSGLTVYRIAKDAGVGTDPVYRFMTGERDLRLDTAAKIAEALNLKLCKIS